MLLLINPHKALFETAPDTRSLIADRLLSREQIDIGEESVGTDRTVPTRYLVSAQIEAAHARQVALRAVTQGRIALVVGLVLGAVGMHYSMKRRRR